jgi:hypothetical protein
VSRSCLALPVLASCTPGLELAVRAADPHALTVEGDEAGTVTCTSPDGDERSGAGVIRGLLAATRYTCAADGGDPTSVETPPLPSDLPVGTLEVEGDADQVGWHLFSVRSVRELDSGTYATDAHYLATVDELGRPRWQASLDGTGAADATWLPGRRVLFGGSAYEGGQLPPAIIDLDATERWAAEEVQTSAWQAAGSWNHEAGIDAAGTGVYALLEENLTLGDGASVSGFVIQHIAIETGEPTWSWSSGEHLAELEPFDHDARDPLHANALWDVPEDGATALYVSLRETSSVLKLDVASGAVLWQLGKGLDFTLLEADGTEAAPERWFHGQHDVKRVGDLLYVFDNGKGMEEVGLERRSRALILELDEDAMTARIAWEWQEELDEGVWYVAYWGGIDPLDGGGVSLAAPNDALHEEDSPPTQLLHVDASGEVSWLLQFEAGVGIYRSERIARF